MILIGELSLWVALLMAVWGATVSFAGGMERRSDLVASGERAVYAAAFMISLASLGLWTALAARDFSLAHVAEFTSANLPRVYMLAAFWAGPAGSLLLWALLLGAFAAVAVRSNRARSREMMPYVTGALSLTLGFALIALGLAENPYQRIAWTPLDGRGLAPLLQQPGMLLHPPVLYAGLAATAVPLALAAGSLIQRSMDTDVIVAIRRWVTVSWLLLTAGILLGMWWAYGQAGWAGSWTRDSIASAALFPWAVNTVLLHSLGARGARGQMLRTNMVLIAVAFLFAIYVAFVSDGGVLSGARSYAQSPVRGGAVVFLVLATAAIGYLLATRLRSLEGPEGGISAQSHARPRAAMPARLSLPIIYAGLAAVAVAVAGQQLGREYDVALTPGQARELRDPFGSAWRFTGQGVSQYNELNRAVVAGGLDIARGGRAVGIITAEQRGYVNSRGEPTADPWSQTATLSTVTQDVQVTALEFGEGESMSARVAFRPLVIWVWIGGLVMLLGGAMALPVPRRDA